MGMGSGGYGSSTHSKTAALAHDVAALALADDDDDVRFFRFVSLLFSQLLLLVGLLLCVSLLFAVSLFRAEVVIWRVLVPRE